MSTRRASRRPGCIIVAAWRIRAVLSCRRRKRRESSSHRTASCRPRSANARRRGMGLSIRSRRPRPNFDDAKCQANAVRNCGPLPSAPAVPRRRWSGRADARARSAGDQPDDMHDHTILYLKFFIYLIHLSRPARCPTYMHIVVTHLRFQATYMMMMMMRPRGRRDATIASPAVPAAPRPSPSEACAYAHRSGPAPRAWAA